MTVEQARDICLCMQDKWQKEGSHINFGKFCRPACPSRDVCNKLVHVVDTEYFPLGPDMLMRISCLGTSITNGRSVDCLKCTFVDICSHIIQGVCGIVIESPPIERTASEEERPRRNLRATATQWMNVERDLLETPTYRVVDDTITAMDIPYTSSTTEPR
jgi:hypothetical protein